MHNATVIAACTTIATLAKSWLTMTRVHADEGTHASGGIKGLAALPPLEQDSLPLMSGQADLKLVIIVSYGTGSGRIGGINEGIVEIFCATI